MPPDRADGPGALDGIVAVSRETAARLEGFVALLRKWQPAENLVAPSTLDAIWTRHVADSAQLLALKSGARRWIDLGSGAGFPGMVVACLLAGVPGAHVDLVESNQRKCAFLRRVLSETRSPATIHQGRIETEAPRLGAADIVTARALAPLPRLLDLAAPALAKGATGLFPKGREFEGEIDEATQSFAFDLVIHKSRIDLHGVILEVSNLSRKGGQAGGVEP